MESIKNKKNMKNKVEILAPAGSFESLEAAVTAGADAVYMGGTRFGARAYADNPEEGQLLRAIDYVHLHGRRIYLTVNTLLKDCEISKLRDYLMPYYCQGLDGIIVQDIGVIEYVRTYFPELAIHASTQMTVTGTLGADFLKSQGIERVVLARELSLEEIKKIKQNTDLQVECFVHGALCYCYSGQCLLSSLLGGRSGNRGQCAQPCRLPYQTGRGKAADIMSLKDLCTIDMIPELIEAGIDSFKIEGRMKQPEYVYTVVSMYRKYTDLCYGEGSAGFKVAEADKEKLLGAYRRRGYCEGYYRRHNGKELVSFSRPLSGEREDLPDLAYKIQEKINGKLILSPGNRAKLMLTCSHTDVECEGMQVQEALKQPLQKERIERQMKKTGGTEFEFSHLDISADGNVFLPMQALNELRREGIRKLEEKMLAPYRRLEVADGPSKMAPLFPPSEDLPELTVAVQETGQLEKAVELSYIKAVYVDCALIKTISAKRMEELVNRGQKSGKEIYLAMPHIFREKTVEHFSPSYSEVEKIFDGILIRNWESYGWLILKGYHKKIIADMNLYLFNRYGRAFLKKTHINAYTAPAELNSRELKELGISDCTLPVYGYQTVMVTAGCIRKTTGQNCGAEEQLYISDRYKKKFAVKNYCDYCYNVIYNSAPLMLLNQRDEILDLSPLALRLDFTVEDAREMEKITALYRDAFIEGKDVKNPDMEFTKGHFKRGVK